MLIMIARKVFRFVQKVLVFVSLVFTYFVAFGLTALFARIFHPRLMGGPSKKSTSFWSKADDYEPVFDKSYDHQF